MSRPSPVAIAVGSVRRLLKEETTYRTELTNQEARLRRWESQGDGEDDEDTGNRAWAIKQEKQAIQETKAVFGPLREKLLGAVAGLEDLLSSKEAEQLSEDEVKEAREMIVRAKAG
ncbi:MAG: hypothetical protein LQ337_000038 [Flavoplaca oasis]|nr:MAG: hypothetical protein LQ337_000038 [Flavoplaca oasis]